MNIQEIINWIKNPENKEKEFQIKFIKRSTGELREMRCKYGVTSELTKNPRRQSYNVEDHKLIIVYDLDKQQYRSIGVEGIKEFNDERIV